MEDRRRAEIAAQQAVIKAIELEAAKDWEETHAAIEKVNEELRALKEGTPFKDLTITWTGPDGKKKVANAGPLTFEQFRSAVQNLPASILNMVRAAPATGTGQLTNDFRRRSADRTARAGRAFARIDQLRSGA